VYGWLWRKLPGPWPVRTLEALALFVGVCAFLVMIVFPWVEPQLPFSDNVVDGGSSPATTAPTTPGGATPDVGTAGPGTPGTGNPGTGTPDDGLAGDG